MPQNKYALARYRLIDNALRKNEYVKTTYLVELCKDRLDYNVSQRTIQMDIEAMKNDAFLGFFAPICYCSKHKAYYYFNKDFALSPLGFQECEINVLDYLCIFLQGKIEDKYYNIFIIIVKRIKKFSGFC